MTSCLGPFIFVRLVIPPSAMVHVVKDDEDFSAGIDEAQAEDLLRQDAQIAERAVLRPINVPLTDGQFDALISFTYNLGGGALQRSTLQRKIKPRGTRRSARAIHAA